MKGFLSAVAFLTRVPVVGGHRDPARAVPWFPVVGSLIGLFVAGVYALVYDVGPSPLAATLAVVAGMVLTGGFHEDGLADSMDAIGSGARGEQALEIMKDSRLGTFGTLAVVVTVVWRILAVAALSPLTAISGLVMAHTLGRAGAVVLMSTTPPAKAEGLGVLGAPSGGAWFAAGSGAVLATLAGGWWVVPGVGLVAAAAAWLRGVSRKRFGGITGDILGACEQLGEMLILTLVVGLTWNDFDPWWLDLLQ